MELKPCPFCGGEAVLDIMRCREWREDSYAVCCSLCDMGHTVYLPEEQAVAAWNTRVKSPTSEATASLSRTNEETR